MRVIFPSIPGWLGGLDRSREYEQHIENLNNRLRRAVDYIDRLEMQVRDLQHLNDQLRLALDAERDRWERGYRDGRMRHAWH